MDRLSKTDNSEGKPQREEDSVVESRENPRVETLRLNRHSQIKTQQKKDKSVSELQDLIWIAAGDIQL